jgi:hypothetical protein
MLVMVTVLPESLRAFWAAAKSTSLLHLAAVPDGVVVVEAVVGAVAVVAGAVVEGDGVAELSPLEELHPAAIRATSTPGISSPTVMRRMPVAPSRFLVVGRMYSLTRGCSDSNWLLAMRILASRYPACEAASGDGGADR